MERIVTVRNSHAAAEEADIAELAALSPQQRLDRALDLVARYREGLGETEQRLARIARIVPLERG